MAQNFGASIGMRSSLAPGVSPGNQTERRLFTVAVLLIAAAGVYFRVWQWPVQLLADDEWHALNKLAGADIASIFTSFGHADHSIPLTLYYHALSSVLPLTENILRWPMLIAGLATPVIAVMLLRGVLFRQEKAVMFALLALSPILIYYTRTARPYALTTLLAFGAIIFFHYWAARPRIRHAAGYVALSSLCAWMQPVTLPFLLGPFLFYGGKSLYQWLGHGDRSLIDRLILLGLAELAVLCALLGPPVYLSLNDIAGKAGIDSPTARSIIDTFKLLTGARHAAFTAVTLLLVAWGAWVLGRRQREFTLYLITCSLLSLGTILGSGAAWIQHPLVMARYSLPLIPVMAVFAAAGLCNLLQLAGRTERVQLAGLVLLSAGIFIAGPLARIYAGPVNQFTGHMGYQFDYDWSRNIYNRQLDNRPVSAFYQELGRKPAGSLRLIIAPWHMEWHWNRWYLDQPIHRQVVTAGFATGFCGDSFYGEYPDDSQRIKLANVIHLSDIGKSGRDHDYLVYHKTASRPELDLGPHADCEHRIRSMFGTPDYEDDQLMAYVLGAR